MKIIYKVGDLLAAEEKFIVHGCNSHGVMGSGVAALIRAKYPKAYEDYRKEFDTRGLPLGTSIWVECSPHTVINAITQKDFGRDPNTVYVSYDAIRAAVRVINKNTSDPVAFPLIGAGLANGKWHTISKIIEEESTNFQPVVYTLDGVIPPRWSDEELKKGAQVLDRVGRRQHWWPTSFKTFSQMLVDDPISADEMMDIVYEIVMAVENDA